MKYVDVVIDNKSDSTDQLYTYGCDLPVSVGQKVLVPFGRGDKVREAYVFRVYDEPEKEIKRLKKVEAADSEIILTEEILNTVMFMKKRYLCRIIDGLKCFVPQGSPAKSGKKRRPLGGDETSEATALEQADLPTAEQQKVLERLYSPIREGKHELFLLHGVTGSGKTEVYMQLVAETIAAKKTAIVLVPEIALTGMIVERFLRRFGNKKVAVLHSKLSQGERYDEWKRIQEGKADIVIGARSAVFAPLKNIGVIIVDEEHESTYKSDSTPKYDAIEIAIKRLQQYNGILLLGSATPSVVSYSRAKEGIYTLLEMKKRYNEVPLPKVVSVDMKQELQQGNRSIFSGRLRAEMRKTIDEGKQIILFLNRRGYSTFVSCRQCGYVMNCPECGISMTYHKSSNQATCHYCGRSADVPKLCPECGSKYIKYFGTGTEKVEEEVAALFPEVPFDRLDLDTTRKKGSTAKILNDFQKGKTKILVGTQLVAKGLDFRNVGLVGIMSADVSLHIPDYRSAERTFQLITQASGRAGRGDEQGLVVIQTYTPENNAVQRGAQQDYASFFKEEIRMRKLLQYPPYCDIIKLLFVAAEEEEAKKGADLCCRRLEETMPKKMLANVFNPQKSPIHKEAGKYRYQIVLKAPKGERLLYLAYIANIKKEIAEDNKKKFIMLVDINPYSFM